MHSRIFAAGSTPSRRYRCILVALLATLGACSDSTAPATIYGTYDLQSVDAKPLPTLLLQEGAYTFKAADGSYEIRDNGTFSSSQTWREDFEGWSHVSTHGFDGTFTIVNDTIFFVWPSDGSSWRGILKSGELSVIDDGHTWLYRR